MAFRRSLYKTPAQLRADLRAMDLRKRPSISETIDWARALTLLGASTLGPDLVRETLGLLLKYEEDRARAEAALPKLLAPKGSPTSPG